MKSVISIPFSRKLSGRTNYRKRLALLKSNLPRLVVRKTLGGMIIQLVEMGSKGDVVKLTVTSGKLRQLGWKNSCKNIPSAYLTGMIAGKMALSARIKKAVPDIGLQSVTKGGRIFAAIKGAKDGGLDIEVSDEILPDAAAISGARISSYAKASGNSQFSLTRESALRINEDFEKLKSEISGGKAQPRDAKVEK